LPDFFFFFFPSLSPPPKKRKKNPIHLLKHKEMKGFKQNCDRCLFSFEGELAVSQNINNYNKIEGEKKIRTVYMTLIWNKKK